MSSCQVSDIIAYWSHLIGFGCNPLVFKQLSAGIARNGFIFKGTLI